MRDAERYYRVMYYGSHESWNLRDIHMFQTLKQIMDHVGEQAKAVVWAHNSHIGDARVTDMGVNRVSLFLSYYNLATRVQNDNASLAALHARTSIVQARLADEKKQEATVVTAAQLVLDVSLQGMEQLGYSSVPQQTSVQLSGPIGTR